MSERIPYSATAAAGPYDHLRPLPVSVLLDNVRSGYNVGAFFRTADAVALEKLYKTALGAEETVAWEHSWDAPGVVRSLRSRDVEIVAIETSVHAVDLFDWQPRFPVCLIFGHEVEGVGADLSAMCDTHIRIPMLGRKHSLNVATAGGVVLFELLRKYRRMAEHARPMSERVTI